MRKKTAIGAGAAVVVLLVAAGIYFSGFGGGWAPLGKGGGGVKEDKNSFVSATSEPNDGMLVVVVQGSDYLIDGKSQSLEEVLAAAERVKPKEAGPQVIVKKKGDARYLSVDKLQKELDARKIKYHAEDDF